MLDDPRQSNSLNSSVEINGDLRYSLETVYFDSPPPAPQSAFKVRLYVHAQLKANSSQDNDIWTVKGTSENLVNKTDPAESIYYIQKSFRVQSTRYTPLDLVLKFKVNEKRLELVSMYLFKNEF
jgi:hypothetical protein